MWPELFLNESTLFMWEFGVKVGDSTGSSQLPHYQTPPVQTHNTSQTLKLNHTLCCFLTRLFASVYPLPAVWSKFKAVCFMHQFFFSAITAVAFITESWMTKELRSYIWMSRSVRQGLCLINASTASLFSSLLSFFFFFYNLPDVLSAGWVKNMLDYAFFGWISLLFLAHVSVEQIISGLDGTDWECCWIFPHMLDECMRIFVCVSVIKKNLTFVS